MPGLQTPLKELFNPALPLVDGGGAEAPLIAHPLHIVVELILVGQINDRFPPPPQESKPGPPYGHDLFLDRDAKARGTLPGDGLQLLPINALMGVCGQQSGDPGKFFAFYGEVVWGRSGRLTVSQIALSLNGERRLTIMMR